MENKESLNRDHKLNNSMLENRNITHNPLDVSLIHEKIRVIVKRGMLKNQSYTFNQQKCQYYLI